MQGGGRHGLAENACTFLVTLFGGMMAMVFVQSEDETCNSTEMGFDALSSEMHMPSAVVEHSTMTRQERTESEFQAAYVQYRRRAPKVSTFHHHASLGQERSR